MMKLLWNTDERHIFSESCMFAGTDKIHLLYPAEKILKVFNTTLNQVYAEGIDFIHTPGTNMIQRTAQSAIPFLSQNEIYPPKENAILYPEPNSNAIPGGPERKLLIFDNEDFFTRHQFEVEYIAVEMDPPALPDRQSHRLPSFRGKLAAKTPVSVTLIGDSISAGYNATKFTNTPPFNPPWIELFTNELAKQFHCEIETRNHGINGSSCTQTGNIEEKWLDPETDLLVIAYGMNDFGTLTPEKYIEFLNEIIEKKKAKHPDTEFLLVASMQGNPEWKHTPVGKDLLFANALEQYVATAPASVALANVSSQWRPIVARKGFYSMTGNGVNHPNDFGHRLYASVLLNLF